LQIDQIDWKGEEITFKQFKIKVLNKETVTTYPTRIMDQLRTYIGNRSGFVFVTCSQKPVIINQLVSFFKRAGENAGIPFKISPHVLQALAVTFLKQQGFSDSDIMRVTGHASAEMIFAYDRSSRADNAREMVCLV
jgi:integrase/recombinase XerD